MTYSFVTPRVVAPGSRLAVVAPCGPFDEAAFGRGVDALRSHYEVTFDPTIFTRKGYLAGDDDRRIGELVDALDDERVDAIVCARGGYGATRILDALDVARVRRARKLLVGFSDVTALHALWSRAGVPSIHGPMVAALGNATDSLRARFIDALEGRHIRTIEGLDPIVEGQADGILIGGNLAVLAALAGTPFAPPLEGSVLFLEDIGERPYRVDRMLTTLHQAGWFERVRGVILGAFTDCDSTSDATRVDEVLIERLGRLRIPVMRGVPSGHLDDNLELHFGRRIAIASASGTLKYLV